MQKLRHDNTTELLWQPVVSRKIAIQVSLHSVLSVCWFVHSLLFLTLLSLLCYCPYLC